MYRWPLPIQLPQESRRLIEKLIDLCPPQCWKTLPDKIGKAGWIPETNTYTCYLHSSPLQYHLSDGSVHVGWFDTKIEKERIWIKPKFRLMQRGKDAAFRNAMALAERQTKEDVPQETCQILKEILLHNPMIIGARESIIIGYTSDITDKYSPISYDRFRNSIFIFRDGTVYEPHPYRVDGNGIAVRKLGSSEAMEFLQQEYSRLVKQ